MRAATCWPGRERACGVHAERLCRRCAQALAAARAAEEGGEAPCGEWAKWWEALFMLKEAEAWKGWAADGGSQGAT